MRCIECYICAAVAIRGRMSPAPHLLLVRRAQMSLTWYEMVLLDCEMPVSLMPDANVV